MVVVLTKISGKNADQSLATSLVFNKKIVNFTKTLIPLLAGYSYVSLIKNQKLKLKWPNDIIFNDNKVGGVLVEESNDLICIGLGINYFWKNPNLPGAGAIYEEKQDDRKIFQDAEEWGRTILNYIENEDFSLENYMSKLTTLGKLVEYPEGRGWAKDINDVEGTQAVFDHRAKMCTLAAQGKWSKDLENI